MVALQRPYIQLFQFGSWFIDFGSDPAFQAEYRPGSNPDLGFRWPKIQIKIKSWKKILHFAVDLFLGLHKGCLRYRRNLQPYSTLLYFCCHFCLLYPDPDSESTDLIESGSNLDHDPKHYIKSVVFSFVFCGHFCPPVRTTNPNENTFLFGLLPFMHRHRYFPLIRLWQVYPFPSKYIRAIRTLRQLEHGAWAITDSFLTKYAVFLWAWTFPCW